MLKQRVITAVVIVLVLFGALAYLSASWLSALFAALILVAAWEWSDMSGIQLPMWRMVFVGTCFIAIAWMAWDVAMYAGGDMARLQELLTATCLWWAVALLWVKTYPASAVIWGSRAVRLAMGLLVLVPGWLAISSLRFFDGGIWLILLVIALVAAADIGAYFSGRRWGKAKLAPQVSPGKSWAGFWGGLVCSLVLATVLSVFWGEHMPAGLFSMLILTCFTVLASVVGDLLESMVKRHRGIKDSSQILPGHGGLMDRIDSLTAAVPVFTLGLLAVGAT